MLNSLGIILFFEHFARNVLETEINVNLCFEIWTICQTRDRHTSFMLGACPWSLGGYNHLLWSRKTETSLSRQANLAFAGIQAPTRLKSWWDFLPLDPINFVHFCWQFVHQLCQRGWGDFLRLFSHTPDHLCTVFCYHNNNDSLIFLCRYNSSDYSPRKAQANDNHKV